jgi:hypothetical protein
VSVAPVVPIVVVVVARDWRGFGAGTLEVRVGGEGRHGGGGGVGGDGEDVDRDMRGWVGGNDVTHGTLTLARTRRSRP